MKVNFGMMLVDAVGKLGGQCVQSNHYGRFARTIVKPANPFSTYSAAVRASFKAISQKWQTITPTQQAAWIAATRDYPRTDDFGNVYYMSGYDLYMSLNRNIVTVGFSMIANPPTKVIPSDTGLFTLTCNPAGPSLITNYVNAQGQTNGWLLYYCTYKLSTGISYVSSRYRLVKIIQCTGQTSNEIGTDYVVKFSSFPTGQRVFVKVICINKVSGSASISNAAFIDV